MERTVTLTLPEPGLYRVTVSDGNDKTEVKWPAGQPMTVVSSDAAPINSSYGQWTAYFYVPRGTRCSASSAAGTASFGTATIGRSSG